MRAATALLLGLLALPALAQETSPDTSPVPEARPDDLDAAHQAETEETGTAAEDANTAETDDVAPTDRTDDPGAETPDPYTGPAPEEDRAACLAALDEIGTVYTVEPTFADPDDPVCGITDPLSVSEIVPGVDIGGALMRCDMALALAQWTRDFAVPGAAYLGNRNGLNGLVPGTTYDCRRRNSRPSGKLSEHAFGNAFDISALTFEEGRALNISPREADGTGRAAAYQAMLRKSACLMFTTVLGPGTDPAHDDHLHFDLAQRPGGYRLCQ